MILIGLIIINLEYIVFTIVFAPLANLPIGDFIGGTPYTTAFHNGDVNLERVYSIVLFWKMWSISRPNSTSIAGWKNAYYCLKVS